MFSSWFLYLLSVLAVWGVAQAAPDKVAPDTVVVTINGKDFTARELGTVLEGAPPFVRQSVGRSRKQFVEQFALMDYLAGQAVKQGLEARSPAKEQLEWNRKQVLFQAAINWKNAQLASATADRQAKLKEWMDSIQDSVQVTYQQEDYFAGGPGADSFSDDTVVASVNGRPMTPAELKSALAGATPDLRANFRRNPKAFLQQYGMLLRLVEVAEKQGLERQSPYKDQLAWTRSTILMQAVVSAEKARISIGPEERKKYYEAHRNDYAGVEVKAIYVPFASEPAPDAAGGGREVLSEQAAKAKIESVRKQAEEGADFVRLVHEYSQDAESREKDGDFGVIHRSDSLPQEFKEAVFSLKEGEISPPVRQANGYYLFRVEAVRVPSLDEVREKLNRDATSAKFNEWFESVRRSVEIRYQNEAYFETASAQ